VACVSINGANRLGSNSLPELLVFGARAGRAAAELATGRPGPGPAVFAQANDERRRLEHDLLGRDVESGGRERIATIRTEMQEIMEQSAGIYRTGDALAKAANRLQELQERARTAGIDDRSRTYNTELITALELECMLDVAESIVHCAAAREESRGAHQRTDFPARDDERFLAHSLVQRNGSGSWRVEYAPVTITRWPPGERVYGR
jgi:fumarate reductase flavoprotein subunit